MEVSNTARVQEAVHSMQQAAAGVYGESDQWSALTITAEIRAMAAHHMDSEIEGFKDSEIEGFITRIQRKKSKRLDTCHV